MIYVDELMQFQCSKNGKDVRDPYIELADKQITTRASHNQTVYRRPMP